MESNLKKMHSRTESIQTGTQFRVECQTFLSIIPSSISCCSRSAVSVGRSTAAYKTYVFLCSFCRLERHCVARTRSRRWRTRQRRQDKLRLPFPLNLTSWGRRHSPSHLTWIRLAMFTATALKSRQAVATLGNCREGCRIIGQENQTEVDTDEKVAVTPMMKLLHKISNPPSTLYSLNSWWITSIRTKIDLETRLIEFISPFFLYRVIESPVIHIPNILSYGVENSEFRREKKSTIHIEMHFSWSRINRREEKRAKLIKINALISEVSSKFL